MKSRLISRQSLLAGVIALSAVLALSACGDRSSAKATPAATAAEHHDDAGEKLTHFSDKTELFIDFEQLIVGKPVTFATHVTRLDDFKPLAKGRVTVVLSGGSGGEERFVADAAAKPGLFTPAGTPKAAGERELTVTVESELGTLTHELGPVTVFADAKAAQAGHGEHADDEDGIAFRKEQQWKIDFATTEVVKGRVRASVAATGTLRAHPDGEALLVAPAGGVLRASGGFPRVGQAVRKGQVLAVLTPRLGGDTDQATLDAGARKARMGLEQARRERERLEVLFKDEAVAEKRLLDARTSEGLAQAEAEAAQARAGQLGGAGGIAIRAPIDGTIADVAVAAGAFVAEGAALLHVANTGRLWLEARVPESEIGRLGSPVGASFTVGGFESGFVVEAGKNGHLIAVGGVVDPASRTIPVVFEFANPGQALRLGMNAKVQLHSAVGDEALLIPASAVQDENGIPVVYVQTGGESFARRVVRVGARDGERIAVLSGLEAGQRVVSKGGYLIRLSTAKAASDGHAGHSH